MKSKKTDFRSEADRSVHILKQESEKRNLRNLEIQEKKSAINRNRTLTLVGILVLVLLTIAFLINWVPELLNR